MTENTAATSDQNRNLEAEMGKFVQYSKCKAHLRKSWKEKENKDCSSRMSRHSSMTKLRDSDLYNPEKWNNDDIK